MRVRKPGYLPDGHGRVEAAGLSCYDYVPTVVVDRADIGDTK